MPDVVLHAETRSEKGSGPAGRLRRAGRLPAIVYGLDTDPVPVTVPTRELQQILGGAAGMNTLITLTVAGAEQLTLARQLQRHPVRGELLHVDFVRIRADQTVSADVPLHLGGTPAGVAMGGILEQQVFTLAIEAKPADLPNAIEHDVSAVELGGQVHVRDLAIPAGVNVLNDPDDVVASVALPRVTEEPEAELEAELEGVEGELEGVEGEAPAAEGGEGGESGEE